MKLNVSRSDLLREEDRCNSSHVFRYRQYSDKKFKKYGKNRYGKMGVLQSGIRETNTQRIVHNELEHAHMNYNVHTTTLPIAVRNYFSTHTLHTDSLTILEHDIRYRIPDLPLLVNFTAIDRFHCRLLFR